MNKKKIRAAIDFARKLIKKMGRDQLRAHSAESAFFILLSVFPILLLLLTLLQFTPIEQEQLLEAMEDLTPFSMRSILEPALESLSGQSTALVSGTVIAAVWASGKSVLGLTDGLNTILGLQETRNYFAVRLRAACYTVVLILALLTSLVLLVFGYRVRRLIGAYFEQKFPDMYQFLELGPVLPVLLAMAVLAVLFLFLYVFLPNRRMRFMSQLPGAIFSSVSWTIFSYGFSVYISLARNMSLIYGSMTTLAVVMLWLYGCMYLLFTGAELNDYLLEPESFEA